MWHTCLIIALATNTPGPTVVWTATASKGLGGIAAAPVELEGEAVFAGLDGLVRGLDALTGTTRWEMAAGQGAPCVLPSSGCGVQSSPTVLSGRVVLFGTNDGELIAFDKRANGTKLWAFSTEGAVMGAAVVAKEAGQFFVYIGSDDRHLYKLQLVAGVPTKRWVVKASGGVNAAVLRVPPFVPGTSGHVVFTSFNGEVWAVREQDGLPLWKFNATAPNGTTFNTMYIQGRGLALASRLPRACHALASRLPRACSQPSSKRRQARPMPSAPLAALRPAIAVYVPSLLQPTTLSESTA